MGFLDKLWDETLAGPPPETGLGKLRKYKSLSATRSPPIINPGEVHVTRTITILKANSSFRNYSPDSVPDSPAGTSAPESPFTRTFSFSFLDFEPNILVGLIFFTKLWIFDFGFAVFFIDGCEAGTPSGDYKRDTRRKAALEAFGPAEPRSPTVYDWFSLFYFFFPTPLKLQKSWVV